MSIDLYFGKYNTVSTQTRREAHTDVDVWLIAYKEVEPDIGKYLNDTYENNEENNVYVVRGYLDYADCIFNPYRSMKINIRDYEKAQQLCSTLNDLRIQGKLTNDVYTVLELLKDVF